MKKKVIVAGHICLDITPIFPDKKVNTLSEIMIPGKLLQVEQADVHTGGAVANTGLAMKLMGADVSLKGKVGEDAFGEMILEILDKYEAKEGMLVSAEESTSYSVVLAVPGIDRIFLHNPGANHSFKAADISKEELEEATLLHFGYPPLMKSMYENEGQELLLLMQKAKEAGCATSLDMAAIDADSEAGRMDWKVILRKVLPYIDYFVPSVEELCFMLDRERFASWQKRAGDRDITEILDVDKDVKPLADMCMEYGAKTLLIKCGAPGIYYRTSEKEGFEKSYVPEKILSGTGAGDTCIAAFLVAMLEGYSLEDALHFAAAQGACCVAAYDALSGLKTLPELKVKIDSGWKKQEV